MYEFTLNLHLKDIQLLENVKNILILFFILFNIQNYIAYFWAIVLYMQILSIPKRILKSILSQMPNYE